MTGLRDFGSILDAHGETLSMRYAKTCLAVWAKEDAALAEVALDLTVQEFLQFGPAVGTDRAFSVGAFEGEHCLLLIHTDKKETVRFLAMAVCGPSDGRVQPHASVAKRGGCNVGLGLARMFHGYNDFSLGVPFSKIPESFCSLT